MLRKRLFNNIKHVTHRSRAIFDAKNEARALKVRNMDLNRRVTTRNMSESSFSLNLVRNSRVH